MPMSTTLLEFSALNCFLHYFANSCSLRPLPAENCATLYIQLALPNIFCAQIYKLQTFHLPKINAALFRLFLLNAIYSLLVFLCSSFLFHFTLL